MKRLLLATDLDVEADLALDRAIQLALDLPALLQIIYVCSAAEVAEAEQRLHAYLKTKERLQTVSFRASVRASADTFSAIVTEAEEHDVDLILMGMHRKAKLREFFVGTTIERVIRKGVRPVLMVRDRTTAGYRRALAGIDFSPGADRAFNFAHELVISGSIYLAHVYHIPNTGTGDKIEQYAGSVIRANESRKIEDYVAQQRELLGEDKQLKGVHVRVEQQVTYESLIAEARQVDAELIAIGVHSPPVLFPNRVGGTAHDILIHPPCDVLITPPAEPL